MCLQSRLRKIPRFDMILSQAGLTFVDRRSNPGSQETSSMPARFGFAAEPPARSALAAIASKPLSASLLQLTLCKEKREGNS